jgi:hypothetical protein
VADRRARDHPHRQPEVVVKLDKGSMLVLAVVLSAPALYFFPGTLVFWCAFAVIYDVFKQ